MFRVMLNVVKSDDDTIICACQYKHWCGWVHYFVVCYGGKQFSFIKDTRNLTTGTGRWWGFNEHGMDLIPTLKG